MLSLFCITAAPVLFVAAAKCKYHPPPSGLINPPQQGWRLLSGGSSGQTQAVRLLTGGSPGLAAQGQRKDIDVPGT